MKKLTYCTQVSSSYIYFPLQFLRQSFLIIVYRNLKKCFDNRHKRKETIKSEYIEAWTEKKVGKYCFTTKFLNKE